MINAIYAKAHLHALHIINNTLENTVLINLNRKVLKDPRFLLAPGGSSHHHTYKHGLVQHVKEVMDNVCKMTNRKPSDELVTAVIWHDYMKIKDYAIVDDMSQASCERVEKLPYRKLINHVTGSAMEFHFHATACLPSETVERIVHLLLSHHGRKEWGSPVEPQTAEAFILHAADMMSAHGVNL